MDTRADFQRLLEDMDKVIQSKRQELTELDERLEIARVHLSEKEASELQRVVTEMDDSGEQQQQRQLLASGSLDEQRRVIYERQLEQFGEELTELESINQALSKANEALRFELSSNREAFEKLQAQSNFLAENLEEVHSANLELNLRLARAEAESQMQQKLLKKSYNEDEVLMNAFNDKLDSMKRAIEWRDDEIRRLSEQAASAAGGGNQLTLESLGATLIVDPTNKQNVIEIANALREKDSQIEVLKGQLLEAAKDLEENANMLEFLKRQESQVNEASRERQRGQKLLEQQEELRANNRMLEAELEAKDKQLSLAELRLHHYEIILPNMISDLIEKLSTGRHQQVDSNLLGLIETLAANLSGLLTNLNQSQRLFDEIEHLKDVCQTKDGQIERLVSDLNELDAKFGLVQQQCDLLQSSRLQPPQVVGATSDSSAVAATGGEQQQPTVSVASSLEKPKASIRASDKKVAGRAPASASSSAVAATTTVATTTTTTTTADSSEQQPVAQRTTKVAASFDRAVLRLQSRLRQLEDENELLELAMKEILLSIKWSDAQCSTVLIDCPSLERLCQLIEARFLARHSLIVASEQQQQSIASARSKSGSGESQIFQLVVLKSELDLLRGQNEQLRAEVKLQRREYREDLLGTAIRQQQQQSQLGQQTAQQLESKRAVLTGSSPPPPPSAAESPVEGSPMEVAISFSEVACQTTTATTTMPPPASGVESCKNCTRLTNLANHLMQCISRIEAHVNMSDESYLNRLVSLHKLNQLLERDLLARESLLDESRRQCHLLVQQKLKAELRLQLWQEHQQGAASTGGGRLQQPAGNVRMYMTAQNGQGDSISQRLTISRSSGDGQGKQPATADTSDESDAAEPSRRYPKARLDYKDERLRQLEALISRNGSSDDSSCSPDDNGSRDNGTSRSHFVRFEEPPATPLRQEIIEVS